MKLLYGFASISGKLENVSRMLMNVPLNFTAGFCLDMYCLPSYSYECVLFSISCDIDVLKYHLGGCPLVNLLARMITFFCVMMLVLILHSGD